MLNNVDLPGILQRGFVYWKRKLVSKKESRYNKREEEERKKKIFYVETLTTLVAVKEKLFLLACLDVCLSKRNRREWSSQVDSSLSNIFQQWQKQWNGCNVDMAGGRERRRWTFCVRYVDISVEKVVYLCPAKIKQCCALCISVWGILG